VLTERLVTGGTWQKARLGHLIFTPIKALEGQGMLVDVNKKSNR